MKSNNIFSAVDQEAEQFSEDSDGNDSDLEIQLAFQKGLLKPGLNVEKKTLRTAPNNTELLDAKLEEIKLNLPWIETLGIVCDPAPMADEMSRQLDENRIKNASGEIDSLSYDDFAREMHFYRLGQAAVLEGLPRIRALDIPTRRPNDYFAPMSKSDKHMHKIRSTLKVKQLQLLQKEDAKRRRDLSKFGKKVQAERLLQRQREKKDTMKKLKDYRQGKSKSLDFLDEKHSKIKAYDVINKKKAGKGKPDANKGRSPNAGPAMPHKGGDPNRPLRVNDQRKLWGGPIKFSRNADRSNKQRKRLLRTYESR